MHITLTIIYSLLAKTSVTPYQINTVIAPHYDLDLEGGSVIFLPDTPAYDNASLIKKIGSNWLGGADDTDKKMKL